MNMLVAELSGTRYAVMRHDPSLEPDRAEVTRKRWADFYPMAKLTIEVDTFKHSLPGYNAFYDAVAAWTMVNGGRSIG